MKGKCFIYISEHISLHKEINDYGGTLLCIFFPLRLLLLLLASLDLVLTLSLLGNAAYRLLWT